MEIGRKVEKEKVKEVEKGDFLKKPKEVAVQEVARVEKEQSECYFYITGLTEELLSELLKKKSLYDKVKIETISNRFKSLVLKNLKEEMRSTLRKLFGKLE